MCHAGALPVTQAQTEDEKRLEDQGKKAREDIAMKFGCCSRCLSTVQYMLKTIKGAIGIPVVPTVHGGARIMLDSGVHFERCHQKHRAIWEPTSAATACCRPSWSLIFFEPHLF